MSNDFDTPGRIKCGTIAAADYDATLADYTGVLGLSVIEEGPVAAGLAAAWGAPALAGRRGALLRHADARPGFLRLVESTPTPGYRPLRSHGWAAYEHTVADCDALFAAVQDSGFTVIGAPKLVPGFDNFIPFQVTGRNGEVLYLNQVLKAGMAELDLPMTTAAVDHMFIAILAAPDREAALAFHRDALGFTIGETWSIPYSVINASFGLPDDTITAMTMTRTGRMPACEIDQYPAAATPRAGPPGELPPGNAMVSFITASLDAVTAPFLATPARHDGALYAGRRSAVVRGAAGELIELIEAQ
ncbi:VOC family protein [Sandarakinorhabdus sp. DWP1-3-1]|uniref:VOC family protein n=1 Tax=Sandarakinorhabdus sp. DWP1-3-1 TaxID=2804627 RepID=UPI003CF55D5F